MQRPAMGLRIAISSSVVILLVLTAVLTLAWRNYQNQNEAALATLAGEADATAETLEAYLHGQLATLTAMAAAPAVSSSDLAAMQELFATVHPELPDFRFIGWVDREGFLRIVAGPIATALPIDLSDRAYIQSAIAERKAVVSEAVISRADLAPAVILAVPATGPDGELGGLVVGNIRLDRSETLPPVLRLNRAGLTIIDTAGQIIVSGGPVDQLRRPADEILTSLSERERGTFSGRGIADERDQVLAYAHVPEVGWAVVVQRSHREVYGPALTTFRQELVGALAAAALLIGGFTFAGLTVDRRSRVAALANEERTAALQRYATLADAMTPIVFEATSGGELTFANRRWEEYTGQPAHGDTWRASIHPSDEAQQVQQLSFVATPPMGDAQLRVRRADGSYRWHLARVVPLGDGPKPDRWIGTLVDIHDRVEGEQAMAQLAAVVNSTSDAVMTFDLNGCVTSWNASAERILGYTEAEMVGRHYHDYTPPVRHMASDAARAQLLAGTDIPDTELTYRRKDGSPVVLAMSSAALRDRAGRVVGATTICRDVTDRVTTEAALRAAEDRLRALLSAIPAQVAIYDTAGQASYFNRRWLDYTGWEAAGSGPDQHFESLVHKDDLDAMRTAVAKVNEAPMFEVRLRDRSGEYCWHLVRTVPLGSEGGGPAEFVMVAVDIQRLKELEAGKEARIADQDAFLGLLAHELRSPLRAISGYTELLQRRRAELSADEQRGALAEVAASSARLEAILVNMLTLAHLELSDADSLEPVLLHHIAERLAGRYRDQLPSIDVSIPADTPPPVLADPVGIEQVLTNFLSNAAKYGGADGSVSVTVRQAAGHVEVSVEDNGNGIPVDEIPRLFEPFFRARAARKEAPGLGLGLAVCKRIVEAYGGTIFARRSTGGGMVFGFSLPILKDDSGETEAEAAPMDERREAPVPPA